MTDPHLEEIKERLDLHKLAIEENAKGIEKIDQKITPVVDIMEDIAAVGRFGNRIKRFGVWLAGILAAIGVIGTAIAGGWEWVQHLRPGK